MHLISVCPTGSQPTKPKMWIKGLRRIPPTIDPAVLTASATPRTQSNAKSIKSHSEQVDPVDKRVRDRGCNSTEWDASGLEDGD